MNNNNINNEDTIIIKGSKDNVIKTEHFRAGDTIHGVVTVVEKNTNSSTNRNKTKKSDTIIIKGSKDNVIKTEHFKAGDTIHNTVKVAKQSV